MLYLFVLLGYHLFGMRESSISVFVYGSSAQIIQLSYGTSKGILGSGIQAAGLRISSSEVVGLLLRRAQILFIQNDAIVGLSIVRILASWLQQRSFALKIPILVNLIA